MHVEVQENLHSPFALQYYYGFKTLVEVHFQIVELDLANASPPLFWNLAFHLI